MRNELSQLQQSTFWRATDPIRAALNKVPAPLRHTLRRGAKAVYWALTPYRIPARVAFLRARAREISHDREFIAPAESRDASPPTRAKEAISHDPDLLQSMGRPAMGIDTSTSGRRRVASVPFIDLSIRRRGSGIIWVNSSHETCKYIREAERSAKTMRTFVRNSEYVLVSDGIQQALDPVFDFQSQTSFHVPACLKDKVHFNGQMIAKLSVLKHMTWERNLYLGSDIAALRSEASGLFDLLDYLDIVVAHAPARIYSRGERDEKLLGLPECFPEMNCDLIAYRRSKAVGEFLSEWERVYSTNAVDHLTIRGHSVI